METPPGHASEIRALLGSSAGLIEQFPYALITGIDSSGSPKAEWASVQKALAGGVRIDVLKGGLLVDSDAFVQLADHWNMFNGFDEAWFLNSAPACAPGTEWDSELWLRYCEIGLEQYLSEITRLEGWMLANNTILGVQDGTGLGFITSQETIATELESIEEDGFGQSQ